jgi:hypothetical protein
MNQLAVPKTLTTDTQSRMACAKDAQYRSWVKGLKPASPAVPTATENEQHDDDNDEECCGIHVILLWHSYQSTETLRVKLQNV